MRETNKKKMVILIAVLLTFTSLFIASVEGKGGRKVRRRVMKNRITYINPDHIWYHYGERAIYVNVSNVGSLLIDIQDHEDGPDSCGRVMMSGSWHYKYGHFADIGVCRFGGGYYNIWAFRIGELYIDPGTEWHIQAPDGEWYCFTLTDYTAPTNWIIKIRASDGVNSLPITEPFYYSYDRITWVMFSP